MATFTTRVQDLVNDGFDFGLTSQDYPIFDEEYRGIQDERGQWQFNQVEGEFFGLNRKIIDHYLYFEIGQESPDMFRHHLNRTMREIMPYYNRLYLTEKMIVDPFQTLSMKHLSSSETQSNEEGHGTTNVTGVSSVDAKGRAVTSNFPQTQLNNSGDYASNATDNFSETASDQDSLTASDEARLGTVTGESRLEISGSSGVRARLLAEFRQSLLNIDLAIIQDLAPLFMLVNHKFDDNYQRRNVYNAYHPRFFPYF